MTTNYYVAELRSDVMFKRTSATVGPQDTLDYIPGSAVLGYCAGQLYPHFTPDESWEAFHCGAVRFGNGYPVSSIDEKRSDRALPLPLSWHCNKSEALTSASRYYRAANLWNLARLKEDTSRNLRDGGVQLEQVRGRWFSPCDWADRGPTTRFTMKTAVDRTLRGRAKESQLFGYERIEQGQKFLFHVESENKGLLDKLDLELSDRRVRLGRSHLAEMGEVYVRRVDVVDARFPSKTADNDAVVVYCMSDVALRDEKGMPTTVPGGDCFGLKKYCWDAGRSFLRTRRYSPFNAKRWCSDLERQVIEKGSVLYFTKGPGAPDVPEGRSTVGDFQQDGFGEIWFNPPFLETETLQKESPDEDGSQLFLNLSFDTHPSGATQAADNELTQWLDGQLKTRIHSRDGVRDAAEYAKALVEGIGKSIEVRQLWPQASQWSNIRTICSEVTDHAGFSKKLEHLMNDGVSERNWSTRAILNPGPTSYSDYLKGILTNTQSESFEYVAALFTELGKLMNRHCQKLGGSHD